MVDSCGYPYRYYKCSTEFIETLNKRILIVGVKTEMRSPGLGDNEITTLTPDPTGFYSSAMELGVYEKDYQQTYQYYNRYLFKLEFTR